jgi:uncharacterized protein YndB with AHSA1/START domain
MRLAGDSYRIAMQPPQGDRFVLSGEFREVDPATRLVYTFRWEPPDPDDQETVVAFSLRDRGGSTALSVDQELFAPTRAGCFTNRAGPSHSTVFRN